jgi:hypothetical protein
VVATLPVLSVASTSFGCAASIPSICVVCARRDGEGLVMEFAGELRRSL